MITNPVLPGLEPGPFDPLYPADVLDYFWHVARRNERIDLRELMRRESLLSVAVTFAGYVGELTNRDRTWLEIEALDTVAQFAAVAERLRETAVRVPYEHRAPVLFLAGWAAWRAGNLELAREALRALPGSCSARDSLFWALAADLDPRAMPRIGSPEIPLAS